MEILGVILVIALVIILIVLAIAATIVSIVAGVVSSIVVSFISAIRSCAIGINDEITNTFVKVVQFIILGLFVLAVATPIVLLVLLIAGVL